MSWPGGFNIRDLGGLPLTDGGTTRTGAVVRAGHPSSLTPEGWDAALEYGIRTVIDLTDGDWDDLHPRPTAIETRAVPLDDMDDTDFWRPLQESGHWGTALYYRPFLRRFPHRLVDAVAAIASAGPGGVLFHCARGRDRTGLIATVLLAIAGVDPVAIADDYDLSNAEATRVELVALGHSDDGDAVTRIVGEAGTTNHAELRALLTDTDVPALLRTSGLSEKDLAAIRRRLTPDRVHDGADLGITGSFTAPRIAPGSRGDSPQ